MQELHDDSVMFAIQAIRLNPDDSVDLLDDLVKVIRGRRIMLKYSTSTNTKCIFLTQSIIWKLRSFFLNKSNNTFSNNVSAEYMNDVFVENLCSIELYLV